MNSLKPRALKEAEKRAHRKALYKKVDEAAAAHKEKLSRELNVSKYPTAETIWFEWIRSTVNKRWLDETEDLRLNLQKQYKDMPQTIAKRRKDILENP